MPSIGCGSGPPAFEKQRGDDSLLSASSCRFVTNFQSCLANPADFRACAEALLSSATPRSRRDFQTLKHSEPANREICEHVIADGNLKIHKMLDNAVIDSLVVTTDNDEMRFARESLCHGLIETASSRRHQNNFRFFVNLRPQFLYGCKNWLWFHDHPLPSSERRIINNAMFVLCPIAQIMNAKIDNLVFLRALHDAFA